MKSSSIHRCQTRTQELLLESNIPYIVLHTHTCDTIVVVVVVAYSVQKWHRGVRLASTVEDNQSVRTMRLLLFFSGCVCSGDVPADMFSLRINSGGSNTRSVATLGFLVVVELFRQSQLLLPVSVQPAGFCYSSRSNYIATESEHVALHESFALHVE